MPKKYFVNADIIRIIAGFAVVFIHTNEQFLDYPPVLGIGGSQYLILSLLDIVSRISIPLFIMLSGYLLLRTERKINVKNFYLRRVKRIIIPLIFWYIIYFIILAPAGTHISINAIFGSFFAVNIGALYFLIIILGLYAVTPLLIIFLQRTNKKIHTIFFVCSIFITVGFYYINSYVPSAHEITNNMFTIFLPYISYYVGGYYLRNITLSSTKNVFALFGFWVVLLFTLLSTNSIGISAIGAPQRQFHSANIFIMTILAFILLINNSFIKQKFTSPRILFWIKIIAASIFGVYLSHQLILMLLDRYTRLTPGNIYSPLIVFVFLKVIIVFVLSFGIVAVGRKVPVLNRIFGE